MFGITAGDTSKTIYVVLVDSTTGLGKTGLVFNSTGFTGSYTLPLAARAAITMVTQTVTGAWSSGGFVEVDATNQPGLYRLDLPNAAIASGAYSVITVGFTGVKTATLVIPLTEVNITSTIADLSQGLPPATPTVLQCLMYLYSALRNKGIADKTASEKQFFNDANTLIWKKAVTKTAMDYTEAEGETGP